MLSSKANTDVRGEMRNAEEIIRADIFYKSSPSLSTDGDRQGNTQGLETHAVVCVLVKSGVVLCQH